MRSDGVVFGVCKGSQTSFGNGASFAGRDHQAKSLNMRPKVPKVLSDLGPRRCMQGVKPGVSVLLL